MGLLSLMEVSSMPMIQVLIICGLGAFMATDSLNLLPPHARKSLNQIVFVVFTPSLMFASLAKAVKLQDVISWCILCFKYLIICLFNYPENFEVVEKCWKLKYRWFMPVNIGLTFVVGGTAGWIAVKILKPLPHLQDLIIAMCSTGNLGYILLIIIPATCEEDGNPFGDKTVCRLAALSYVSFSMAIGSLYTWTYTYHLIQSANNKYRAKVAAADDDDVMKSKEPTIMDFDVNDIKTPLLLHGSFDAKEDDHTIIQTKIKCKQSATERNPIFAIFHQILEELMAPPVLAAMIGLVFGAVSWLRNLIIGENAPFRVIQDSIQLLGDGTIPCITLILGGNLRQGLSKSRLGWKIVVAVIIVRCMILPAIGIGVVKAASHLGFLPPHPLYHFVLMIQFTIPPSMNIGTMTQLFDVAQEECSVLFLWTYLVAAFALTGWSTLFMWILS